MIRVALLAGMLALAAISAFAQSVPCERGSHVIIAGRDGDLQPCYEMMLLQHLASAENHAAEIEAQLKLSQYDLATSESKIKDWQDYFAKYIGAQ